jgi:hypothetical protein
MSLGMSWCSIEEAVTKYSLEKSLILKWVDEGVVRAETVDKRVVSVNLDDLELEVQERGGIFKE